MSQQTAVFFRVFLPPARPGEATAKPFIVAEGVFYLATLSLTLTSTCWMSRSLVEDLWSRRARYVRDSDLKITVSKSHSTRNWSSKTHPEQSAVVTLSKTCAQPIIMCWNEIVEYYAPLWRAVLGHRFLLGPFHRDYTRSYVWVCSRFGKAHVHVRERNKDVEVSTVKQMGIKTNCLS